MGDSSLLSSTQPCYPTFLWECCAAWAGSASCKALSSVAESNQTGRTRRRTKARFLCVSQKPLPPADLQALELGVGRLRAWPSAIPLGGSCPARLHVHFSLLISVHLITARALRVAWV